MRIDNVAPRTRRRDRPPSHAGEPDVASVGEHVVVAGIIVLGTLALASCGARDTAARLPADGGSSHPVVASPATGAMVPVAARLAPVDPAGILARAREPGARATLVNVWASWCAPCREEFPDLLRLTRDYRSRGLRVMFVSADLDSADAKRFLAAQGVEFETYLQVGDAMQFINQLDPRWTGALPATFVYDSNGKLARFWEGRADYATFETAALTAMRGPEPTP